ncbi:MAG: DUF2125 domain-containing protein [Pseudomonadota bacterium]|nr:DUF2125 domain-containing protein [Pseudomonadota bacterium]
MSRKRKLLASAAAILGMLVLAWTGLWFYAAGQTGKSLAALQETVQRDGGSLTWSSYTVSGFPAAIRLELKDVRLEDNHGILSSPSVTGYVRPWNWTRIHLPQMTGLVLSLKNQDNSSLLIAAGTADATIDLDMALRLRGVALSAGPVTLKASPAFQGIGELTLDSIRTSARLTGDMPAGPDAGSWQQWRDRGGALEVDELTLSAAPFSATLTGTATLDARMRPLGAFTVDARGLDPLVNSMATGEGQLPQYALLIRLALLALPKAADANGQQIVRIPVTAQDGKLSVLSQTLADLEPFEFAGIP